MHFNVNLTEQGMESKVATINSQSIPNKGDEIEIVRGQKSEKFKVTGVERKYINGVNNIWNSFITVNVVRYD